jgi:hypothetical protein
VTKGQPNEHSFMQGGGTVKQTLSGSANPAQSQRRKAGRLRARASAASKPAAALEKAWWDAGAHTFYWLGKIVKHFRGEPQYQEAVLAAFEQAGWPPCLPVAALAGAGLAGKHRLQVTIRKLNQSVKPQLRFGLEGHGSRVYWEAGKRR